MITDYGKDVIQLEQRMAELAAADAARTKNTMNAMQPPQSIEEIKAGLETTEKGGVRQSIRNCLTVFQRDPLLSGAIAYNILTDRKDIIKPIGFHRESTALNDTDMKYLLLYLEETYGLTNEKRLITPSGLWRMKTSTIPSGTISIPLCGTGQNESVSVCGTFWGLTQTITPMKR